MEVENRVKKVLSLVFEKEENYFNELSSPDNVDTWDSIAHINLAVALEKEFNLELNEEEIMELMNFKLIVLIIKEKTGLE